MSEELKSTEKLDLMEIRSEEMQEIMGYIPRWIVRWGITVISVSVLFLLVGSWFFKYPDILTSTIMVITENPPTAIVPHSSGKIRPLLVTDNQLLKKDDLIAVLDNPADYLHMLKAKEQLAGFRSFIQNPAAAPAKSFVKDYKLGDVQSTYELFLKTYSDFLYFHQLDYHRKKITSIEMQIGKHRELLDRFLRQHELVKEEYQISQRDFERRQKMFQDGYLSPSEFENVRSGHLQKEYTLESAKTAVDNENLQISQLENSIADLQLQFREQRNGWETNLKQALDNVLNQIEQWEYRYLLKSPMDGRITFTTFWSENQFVQAGATVFSVVPAESRAIIGRLMLPIAGSGKVKTGQRVNIKFANYPYMEYGMVRGLVRSISLVPAEQVYLVEVALPEGLRTNYGKDLLFSQQMQGTGEIVTDDMRVLERIFQPLRAAWKKE